MNTLLLAVLSITADCPPLLALPSFRECTRRHETATAFEKNITAYADECRRAFEIAGSFTTRERLMEAELWENYAKTQTPAWYAATYVTWPRQAASYYRQEHAAKVMPVWRRP